MPDPTIDIRPYIQLGNKYFATRFVFQVPFPRLDISEQWVVFWWNDSLDAVPRVWPTNINYTYDPYNDIKDIIVNSSPGIRIELIDTEHTTMRDYVNYNGVAAIGLRSLSVKLLVHGTYIHLAMYIVVGIIILDVFVPTVNGLFLPIILVDTVGLEHL